MKVAKKKNLQYTMKVAKKKKLTIQRGTLATSGSEAMRLQNLVMATTPSSIPSSMLKIEKGKLVTESGHGSNAVSVHAEN